MKHRGTISLQTQHLLLRRFTEEDIMPMFINWAGNPRVTRYLMWSAHTSHLETQAAISGWIRQYQDKNFYQWAIVEKESGMLIGSAGLVPVPESRNCCEAGYCFGEHWWHKGYATETLILLLDFAVNKVGYKKVIAKHAVDNPASGRVMQKAGMHLCIGKTLRVPTENGEYDCYQYEYTPQSSRHFFW